MLVKVIYYDDIARCYAGYMGYTYKTDLPLRAGDKVKAPAGDKISKAMVIETNVHILDVPQEIRPKLKSITEYDRGE